MYKGSLHTKEEEIIDVALKTITTGIFTNIHDISLLLLCTYTDNPTPSQMEEFTAESVIMLDFDHPNVLKLLGVCFHGDNNKLPMIVLPFMANGDLKSFLVRKRGDSEPNVLPEVSYSETSL